MAAKRISLAGQSHLPRLSKTTSGDFENVPSEVGFKQWHKRMQANHENLGGHGFRLWHWCYKCCTPCRWIDAIEVDKKLCVCCLTFSSFKYLGTMILVAAFSYAFLYSILKNEVLPGGTLFFLFILTTLVFGFKITTDDANSCLSRRNSVWVKHKTRSGLLIQKFFAAYVMSYVIVFIGLPPLIGPLLVGIIVGNIPRSWLPPFDEHNLEEFGDYIEKIVLVTALIRAGLHLDVSRIKGHVPFIIQIALLPLLSEIACIWVSSHYLLNLPWDWSALQGSVLSIVSLASVTTIMEKAKENGYGEDKNLSAVLLAASASDLIFGIFAYVTCISYLYPYEWIQNGDGAVTYMLTDIALQLLVGLSTGIVCGLLISFFPDKRNPSAASWRIAIIGLSSFAISSLCYEFQMMAAGVLGTIINCLIASNMWEEMGWHESNNPVQYFYSMIYYFSQPMVLSLIGFSLQFSSSPITGQIGWSFVVILIGLVGRETVCFLVTLEKIYPTTIREKLFICIAWFSKGTFQALLAYAAEYLADANKKEMTKETYDQYVETAKLVKTTTVLAILFTTPFVYYSLSILTPILLTKKKENEAEERTPES